MSRVEHIESQVRELTNAEMQAFRRWFAEFDAAAWDRRFEEDVKAGKFNDRAQRALRNHVPNTTRLVSD
jgi:hypothetical protein